MNSQQWDSEGRWRADRQDVQFAGLGSVPGAVVTTIGGNDIGFAAIVEACVKPSATQCGNDLRARNELLSAIAGQRGAFSDWYRSAWKLANTETQVEARNGEYAPVLVLGYPHATPDDRYGGCGTIFGFTAFEVRFANEVTRTLNAAVKAAVGSARADGYEVYYVDRSVRAFQPDNTVCARNSWINGIGLQLAPLGPKSESFHPNIAGFQAITAAVVGWSRSVERQLPDEEAIADSGYIGPDPGAASAIGDAYAASQPIARVDFDGGSAATVSPRQRIDVSASGFGPGSVVLARLFSQPTVLGPMMADESGVVRSVVAIPSVIEFGRHDLVLSGVDDIGVHREVRVPLSIVPQLPLWLAAVLMVAAVCLVGSIVLGVLSRRMGSHRGASRLAKVNL